MRIWRILADLISTGPTAIESIRTIRIIRQIRVPFVPDARLVRMARIVAPVSRHLDVSDVARTVAFYRDVLGFTVARDGPAEVTSGPARITLGAATADARYVLFFEVDDVSAMRSALAARGAH